MGYSNLHEDVQVNCPSCGLEHITCQNFQLARCFQCQLQEIEEEHVNK